MTGLFLLAGFTSAVALVLAINTHKEMALSLMVIRDGGADLLWFAGNRSVLPLITAESGS
jgi:hypothetical protein